LIHEKAVSKVERHISDAISKGAQVLVGGRRLPSPGTFFAPTILSDVPNDTIISQEETFGPVAALTKFKTENEVIEMANNTDVGLAGYFYSRDIGRAWRVAERLEVGMVGINTGIISQAVIPFGGVKESGLGESFFFLHCSFRMILMTQNQGREGGHGIEEYMNTKLMAFGGI
jgi:succinate-semialdehyde dehydrogenase / glutarate-semialdehyde dehydrogenase